MALGKMALGKMALGKFSCNQTRIFELLDQKFVNDEQFQIKLALTEQLTKLQQGAFSSKQIEANCYIGVKCVIYIA